MEPSENPAHEPPTSAPIRLAGREACDSKCDACNANFDGQRKREDRPRSCQRSMPTRIDAPAEPAGSVGELCVVATIVSGRFL